MDLEAPDAEINPFTGGLSPIPIQQNSFVQNSINRKLLYTKAEIDALLAAVGTSTPNLWEDAALTSEVWVTPTSAPNHLIIGTTDDAAALSTNLGGGIRAMFIDNTNQGLTYFTNTAYGGNSFVPLGGTFVGGHAGGTATSPSATGAGNNLGIYGFMAHDDSVWTINSGSFTYLLAGFYGQALTQPSSQSFDFRGYLGALGFEAFTYDMLNSTGRAYIYLNRLNQSVAIKFGSGAGVTFQTEPGTGNIGINATPNVNNRLLVNDYVTGNGAADVQFTAKAADHKPLIVQGFTSQSVALQEWQDSTGAILRQVDQNGAISKRVATLTDAATVTPNSDTADAGILTTLSQATTIANPTGSPYNMQQYQLRIKSTTARALTWGNQFRGSNDLPLPAITSGNSKTDYFGFEWNSADSKWDIMALNRGF
jgi:hypothetical protein